MCGDWVGTVVFLFDSTGSGCVSAFVSQILGTSAAYICTDINARATECTIETGARNKVSLQPVLTSSVEALRPRVDGAVDLLIFNPTVRSHNRRRRRSGTGTGWTRWSLGGWRVRHENFGYINPKPHYTSAFATRWTLLRGRNTTE